MSDDFDFSAILGKPKKDAPVIKQKAIDTKERIHWNKW